MRDKKERKKERKKRWRKTTKKIRRKEGEGREEERMGGKEACVWQGRREWTEDKDVYGRGKGREGKGGGRKIIDERYGQQMVEVGQFRRCVKNGAAGHVQSSNAHVSDHAGDYHWYCIGGISGGPW